VYPNYKSSSNSEPNRRLFAVEGVGGHFVFFGQNTFERAFMSVYLVFSFSRIVLAIVFKCRTVVQEHAKKVFFQVLLRFCRRMRNILRYDDLHF